MVKQVLTFCNSWIHQMGSPQVWHYENRGILWFSNCRLRCRDDNRDLTILVVRGDPRHQYLNMSTGFNICICPLSKLNRYTDMNGKCSGCCCRNSQIIHKLHLITLVNGLMQWDIQLINLQPWVKLNLVVCMAKITKISNNIIWSSLSILTVLKSTGTIVAF